MLSSRCLWFLCFEFVHKCGHKCYISCMEWLVCSFLHFHIQHATVIESAGLYSAEIYCLLLYSWWQMFVFLFVCSRAHPVVLSGMDSEEEQLSHPEKRKPSRRRNKNKFESFAKKVWCQRPLKSSSRKVPLFSEKKMPHAVFPTSRH